MNNGQERRYRQFTGAGATVCRPWAGRAVSSGRRIPAARADTHRWAAKSRIARRLALLQGDLDDRDRG